MTYNVFGGTLSLTQSINLLSSSTMYEQKLSHVLQKVPFFTRASFSSKTGFFNTLKGIFQCVWVYQNKPVSHLKIPSTHAPFSRSTSSDSVVCIHGNLRSGKQSACISMISSSVLPNIDGWNIDFCTKPFHTSINSTTPLHPTVNAPEPFSTGLPRSASDPDQNGWLYSAITVNQNKTDGDYEPNSLARDNLRHSAQPYWTNPSISCHCHCLPQPADYCMYFIHVHFIQCILYNPGRGGEVGSSESLAAAACCGFM